MKRYYYAANIVDFLQSNPDEILGELSRAHTFSLEDLQKNAWIAQITLLKTSFAGYTSGYICFEYVIPRMGKRVDVVFLYEGIVFAIEFKVGANKYDAHAIEQALDYAIDLKNFHEQSHDRIIMPILCATTATEIKTTIEDYEDGVIQPLLAGANNLSNVIVDAVQHFPKQAELKASKWISSVYKPTPTIIQAAQALYQGHNVQDISTSDSSAINLSATSDTISTVIETSKGLGRKSICFVTGVPGAGKTLAGLNIANQRQNSHEDEHAVFLSGNGPLVDVLREALARDQVLSYREKAQKITKKQALTKTHAFIQNIHHFRDDSMATQKPPIEKVVIFDEAQRAWTLEQTRSFMKRRKGVANFNQSEPDFLISVMDRHEDWSVIVCLIGGGQEINTGEAGLEEWFRAIGEQYPNWDVYVSNMLQDHEYTNGVDIFSLLKPHQLNIDNNLHLGVSVRSFRSEAQAAFVKSFLDCDVENARSTYLSLKDAYPIVITRDLNRAKAWLRAKARGSESFGLVAQSGAYRLRPYGIHVKSQVDPKTWFLNPPSDVRSASFLEEVATEFDIQGLELDWVGLAWSASLRKVTGGWDYKAFKGTKWMNVHQKVRQRYLLNAYRVLLTRARQGLVIFVPRGDDLDHTRLPEFYDPVFSYLRSIGIEEI